MAYGRTPKGGAKNSVAAKIARGQSKPAMTKKKPTKKANGKGFMDDVQSKIGNKIDKKKKSFKRKIQKVKGMFK